MRNSDLVARIAAGLELVVVLLNLFLCFLWFISLVWVLVGLLWVLLGLVVLVEGGIAVYTLIRGASPVGIAGPVIGIIASLFNFNLLFGVGLEGLVLALMVVAVVMRNNEAQAT